MLYRALALSTLAASPLFAQTATVADSLYALAVDPAAHADLPYVWLLDEGVYTLEADGRVKNTTRQVVQILKPEGAEAYRERRFSWNPEHQKLTVNWMRVVKPNGEIVSAHPEQIQIPFPFRVDPGEAAVVQLVQAVEGELRVLAVRIAHRRRVARRAAAAQRGQDAGRERAA